MRLCIPLIKPNSYKHTQVHQFLGEVFVWKSCSKEKVMFDAQCKMNDARLPHLILNILADFRWDIYSEAEEVLIYCFSLYY